MRTDEQVEMAVLVALMTCLFALGFAMMFFGRAGVFSGLVTWIIGFLLFGWRFLWGAVIAASSEGAHQPEGRGRRSVISSSLREEDQMFGKGKVSSQEKDGQLPPASQLQDSTPISLAEPDSTEMVGKISSEASLNVLGRAEPDSTEISREESLNVLGRAEPDSTETCIGPGMTVVGKISSEGSLNVLGRVEGELRASIVRISNGAHVDGTIVAQKLTIGGRFKGTIQADRVTLTSSAVVEGEIHHRSLAIEENAWFAGVSRPKENLASEDTDSPTLVPTDANRQLNGSLEREVHAD